MFYMLSNICIYIYIGISISFVDLEIIRDFSIGLESVGYIQTSVSMPS